MNMSLEKTKQLESFFAAVKWFYFKKVLSTLPHLLLEAKNFCQWAQLKKESK